MPIVIFLIISFSVSWAIAGMLDAAGGFNGTGALSGLYLTAFMFGPAIGALVTTAIYDRKRFARSLGFTGYGAGRVFAWMAIGWLLPIILCALAVIIAGLVGTEGFRNPVEALAPQIEQAAADSGQEMPLSTETLVLVQFGVGLPIGILINTLLLTISEEVGWRGWLQPRLMRLTGGFWPMCLFSGLIWGLWHAPIIVMGYNYPGMPVMGPMLMVTFCVLLTPYVAEMRERGSVWAAGAFHGSLNAVAGMSLLFLDMDISDGVDWTWRGIMGVPGFAVMAAGCVLLFLWRRKNPPARTSPQLLADASATPSPADPESANTDTASSPH